MKNHLDCLMNFYLIGGKKMSSSKGIGLKAHDLVKILPPQLDVFFLPEAELSHKVILIQSKQTQFRFFLMIIKKQPMHISRKAMMIWQELLNYRKLAKFKNRPNCAFFGFCPMGANAQHGRGN